MQTSTSIPIVAVITPEASTVGCRVTVTGANFLDGPLKATVGGVPCQMDKLTDTSVIVIVAKEARTGAVVLSNDMGSAANTPTFNVTVERPTKLVAVAPAPVPPAKPAPFASAPTPAVPRALPVGATRNADGSVTLADGTRLP